jgi:capsule polysaccharide modification protein KpsS
MASWFVEEAMAAPQPPTYPLDGLAVADMAGFSAIGAGRGVQRHEELDPLKSCGAMAARPGKAASTAPADVALNPAYALLRNAGHALLLQGPVGPFFDRLTDWLGERGTRVTRVVFQGGDRHDAGRRDAMPYTGTPGQWPQFLRALLRQQRPDCIVLFGQSRSYHRAALQIGVELGIPVVVLEEGYFRPGYVTMELGGVNSHSSTMQRHRWMPSPGTSAAGLAPQACRWHFAQTAWHAARHYAALWLQAASFPGYQHHRDDDPWQYAAYWLRSWVNKLLRLPGDTLRGWRLARGAVRYFFVPLQHDDDSQITHHSGYARNAEFVLEVMHSFAAHADPAAQLVFKQHPQSRGGSGHGVLIRRVAAELAIGGRVLFLVEGDTRELCRHAQGVVVINSTVGLQALEQGTPLMVMGEAVYKRPHLAHAAPLHTFWRNPPRPDATTVADFLLQLKNLTQMPVSIYAARGEPLAWP